MVGNGLDERNMLLGWWADAGVGIGMGWGGGLVGILVIENQLFKFIYAVPNLHFMFLKDIDPIFKILKNL